ncbi:MAG: hypothetical protein M1815_005211 [Lichina confinis]|nr:MAG: hypothetical protein M1815_005211 [Lichina confinis]
MDSDPSPRQNLTESISVRSDSESYSANNDPPSSPPSSSSSPIILYSPPTIWSFLRGTAINLLLPFVNGLMLGFGELLAHEAAFRLGWGGTRVFPGHRNSRPVGPGIEVQESSREARHGQNNQLEKLTSLE